MLGKKPFEVNVGEAACFLQRIIEVQSLPGGEEDLMRRLQAEFAPLCDSAELIPMPENLADHPLYCNVVERLTYAGRHNLKLKVKGRTEETMIINAHADTVPAPEGIYRASEKDGIIYGRGACDDKGQIAVIYLLLLTLKSAGIHLAKSIEVHIVAEEEVGGNGTLAIMQEKMSAVLAVVMEPTGLKIVTGSRGALWFKAAIRGVAGHSGQTKAVKSALKGAVTLMDVMDGCHKNLFARLAGVHPFEEFENPMPLTFGKLHAGDWPATAPGEAVLEGVFGFLPGICADGVIHEIEQCMQMAADRIEGCAGISYPLRRDSVVTDRELPCVADFTKATQEAGITPVYSALPACCDAWFYTHEKGIPVLIFGAGELYDAHSGHEQIKLIDMVSCAMTLYGYANMHADRP